ncbi:hypothetical protein SEETLT22_09376 [Salmonella enterica subsp. enterica serovar Typhimurium str. LT2-4]|nr:hypothetical protein SEETLT22_09376 [Salmonella enterica subsp. enterica serovar Typhimurium str. LT2-4]
MIGLPDPAAHYSMMLHPGSPPFSAAGRPAPVATTFLHITPCTFR